MATRIFYALQNVLVAGTPLKGVQTVGASSTTNLESFSAFGSLAAHTILQDMDLELTVESALGDGWNSALNLLGYTTFSADFFDTANDITIQYLTSTGTMVAIKLNAVLTSYQVQMGTDGPATESLTFQNAGTAVFTTGTGGSALGVSSENICDVITRPNFTSFNEYYRANCCSEDAAVSTPVTNLLSFSASMDAGNEKINVLGQSMPFGKFATFPIETSMEIERHLDPSTASMDSFNSGTISGNSLVDACYNPTAILGGHTYSLNGARLASISRSGGDVGGGNVSISQSYTGYNDFGYSNGGVTTTSAP